MLFPWKAKVYDRDLNNKSEDETTTGAEITSEHPANNKEVQKRTHTYYQVSET